MLLCRYVASVNQAKFIQPLPSSTIVHSLVGNYRYVQLVVVYVNRRKVQFHSAAGKFFTESPVVVYNNCNDSADFYVNVQNCTSIFNTILECRTRFKILLLTFKALNDMAPAYIKTHLFKVAFSLKRLNCFVVVKFILYTYLVCFNIVMRF